MGSGVLGSYAAKIKLGSLQFTEAPIYHITPFSQQSVQGDRMDIFISTLQKGK